MIKAKHALITGANKGIGREVAIELARNGWDVVASGRNMAEGQAVVAEIRKSGGTASFLEMNVSDEASIRAAAQAFADSGASGPDVLINNAGILLDEGDSALSRVRKRSFVRRILQHIEIPLPDLDGRGKIWQHMISPAVPGRDMLDWTQLATASDGLSGGEIKNAVIISLSETANRSGTERVVSMTDIQRAIDDVKRAKKDIGRYDFHNNSQ
jgi:hypothetical protein